MSDGERLRARLRLLEIERRQRCEESRFVPRALDDEIATLSSEIERLEADGNATGVA